MYNSFKFHQGGILKILKKIQLPSFILCLINKYNKIEHIDSHSYDLPIIAV